MHGAVCLHFSVASNSIIHGAYARADEAVRYTDGHAKYFFDNNTG